MKRTILNRIGRRGWIVAVLVAAAVLCVCVFTNLFRSADSLVPGTSYQSAKCLYMAAYSSIADSDDSGFLYTIRENAFVITQRDTGMETVIEVPVWEWQPAPYTVLDWKNLFWPVLPGDTVPSIGANARYQPLGDGMSLLRVEDSLWLVQIDDEYIRSIYTLEECTV